jgi:RimJ/RimL family protein N-acetyltransferase
VRLRTAGESFNPGQAANMLDHVRSGYQGFVLRRDEEIIGHFWWIDRRIAPHHPHLAEYHIPLVDDDVYCFEYFIAPRHRGGGVATDALQAMEAHLREQGYRRVWGTVDADNTPARWLYLSNGWTVAHTVTTTRLLGRRRATVEEGASR